MSTSEMPHKYILVGSSGVGKTTMADTLYERFGLKRCITTTTRPPRSDEIDGVDYHFKSGTQFVQDEMFEHASFGGFEYGITMNELKKGDVVILDPQGVDYYKENYPGPLTIIKLERKGIEIDEARRTRDKEAGFDHVKADIVIHGETIVEMSEHLIAGILSHEMENVRCGTSSPLSKYFLKEEITGSARLHFIDSRFGLSVCCEKWHHDYSDAEKNYADFNPCFDTVDYSSLNASCRVMLKDRIACTLDFDVRSSENSSPMYFSRVELLENKLQVEVYPDYLGMDPLEFTFDNAGDAVRFAFGGFVATEIDCLGKNWLDMADSDAVLFFRKLISEGRFELLESELPTPRKALDEMIEDAEKSCSYSSKKRFSPELSL